LDLTGEYCLTGVARRESVTETAWKAVSKTAYEQARRYGVKVQKLDVLGKAYYSVANGTRTVTKEICRSLSRGIARHRHGLLQILAVAAAVTCVVSSAGTAAPACVALGYATAASTAAVSLADHLPEHEYAAAACGVTVAGVSTLVGSGGEKTSRVIRSGLQLVWANLWVC
jgi:hypothetical protein